MSRTLDALLSTAAAEMGLEGRAVPLHALDVGDREQRLRAWLDQGHHATMDWLRQSLSTRISPTSRWPWARSALVVLLPYALPAAEVASEAPLVAGYARSRDYHYRLDGLLKKLQQRVEELLPAIQSFRFCDDQPLPEVDLAVAAGLGWRGRHSLLLHRGGSAFHIGGLLLSVDVPMPPSHPDHCGTCRACLDACPTNAITDNRTVRAEDCISHWNIEDRSTPEGRVAQAVNGEIFGCDLCQQACPWNRKAMGPAPYPDRWPTSWEAWVDLCRPGGGFQSVFTKTPLRRAGRHKLLKVVLRNLENIDRDRFLALCARALETETHPGLREWIGDKLGRRHEGEDA